MSEPDKCAEDIPVPPHVYIPGLTPRHPDGWFDDIKDSVSGQEDETLLHKTRAFRCGLAWLQAGYFWECHEVLEAVWLKTADPGPERDIVLALIQLANARLKQLMRRPRAALRLCDMVEAHLSRCPSDRLVLGLDPGEVRAWSAETRRNAERQYSAYSAQNRLG